MCSEIPTLRQIIEKAPAFTGSRHQFRDIKRRLRVVNTLPPPLFIPSLDSDFVMRLLPERTLCEHWTSRYFEKYGRLFDVIHPGPLAKIIESIWSKSSDVQVSSISLVVLVIAVAMQDDDDNRLLGRRVAQQLQDFFYSSGVLRKPNLEVFQNHCLLLLLMYIAASDTDKLDGMSCVLGKTRQMAFAMGLHRDPSLFPTVGPYAAGLRKRLWWSFYRLALECSVQSGTPLVIRTDDADCPPPSNVGWSDGQDDIAAPPGPKELSVLTESTFSVVMCMLATRAASIQQAIYRPISEVSMGSCKELCEHTEQILATIPECLRREASNTDGIKKLQQCLISILACRSSLLLSTHVLLTNCAPERYRKTLLLKIWESSRSILRSVQMVSSDADIWRIGRQLVWADACRAIFCAAMVLQKLRQMEKLSVSSSNSLCAIVPIQQALNAYLSHMSDLWLQKASSGPTVAKAFLYLRVLTDVGRMALGANQTTLSDEELLAAGVRSANSAVETLRGITESHQLTQQPQQSQQQQQQQHIQNPPFTMLTPPEGDHAQPAFAAISSSPTDGSEMFFSKHEFRHCATSSPVDDLQFAASVAFGSASQCFQQDYLSNSEIGSPLRPFTAWDGSVSSVMQSAATGSFLSFSAEALQHATSAVDESLLMALLDEGGKSSSLPVDFDPHWANC